jgi:hypothetical protein
MQKAETKAPRSLAMWGSGSLHCGTALEARAASRSHCSPDAGSDFNDVLLGCDRSNLGKGDMTSETEKVIADAVAPC